jgi:hypothetical protein
LEIGVQTLCGVHPKERAVDVCARCGTFLCFGCVLSLMGTVYCAPCVDKLNAPPPPEPVPSRVYGYLWLSILGFILPPFALLALVLGTVERRWIHKGTAPAAGDRLARLAVSLGLFGVLVSLVTLPFMIAFLLEALR